MYTTAQEFKQFFHTLSQEQIDQYITDGKLFKGIKFDLSTKSKGEDHIGGGNLVVYFACNEGTVEQPVWVDFYESASHQKSLEPAQIKAMYEYLMSTYPEFGAWAFTAFGGPFQIRVRPEPQPEPEPTPEPES